jgi:integrase
VGIDVRYRDFRRSLASFLIVADRADEAAVTALLGHANNETTRRILSNIRNADDQALADAA